VAAVDDDGGGVGGDGGGEQVYDHFAEERFGGIRYQFFIKEVLNDVG